ncbi:MAG TPA: hypothetical protein PKW34_01810, partial [Candidatus Paceibacterota bacterium]|nr:hypothetical protein [Candidatus Paceibacterota bacterium]
GGAFLFYEAVYTLLGSSPKHRLRGSQKCFRQDQLTGGHTSVSSATAEKSPALLLLELGEARVGGGPGLYLFLKNVIFDLLLLIAIGNQIGRFERTSDPLQV